MTTNDSSTTTSADPLTTAELDQLDALNRARTPGPLTVDTDGRHDARIVVAATGSLVALACGDADGAALAAALNALPAMLAEVRAARAAAPVATAPDDTGPRLYIPRDLLGGAGGS